MRFRVSMYERCMVARRVYDARSSCVSHVNRIGRREIDESTRIARELKLERAARECLACEVTKLRTVFVLDADFPAMKETAVLDPAFHAVPPFECKICFLFSFLFGVSHGSVLTDVYLANSVHYRLQNVLATKDRI